MSRGYFTPVLGLHPAPWLGQHPERGSVRVGGFEPLQHCRLARAPDHATALGMHYDERALALGFHVEDVVHGASCFIHENVSHPSVLSREPKATARSLPQQLFCAVSRLAKMRASRRLLV